MKRHGGAINNNKKIKNAQKCSYRGFMFDSKMEASAYEVLDNSGLIFEHEPVTVVLWSGFKDKDLFWFARTKNGIAKKCVTKQRDWTYTPDFVVTSRDGKSKVFIEMKGFRNDIAPYKMKIFLKILSESQKRNNKEYLYAEVRSISELRQLVKILKDEGIYSKQDSL